MFHVYDCLGIKVFPWKLYQSKNGVCDESPPKRWTVAETFAWRLTPFVSQRRHNGGTRKAEASLKLNTQSLQRYAFFTGRPMADPCASIGDHGDVCAFLLPPWSDLWATDLLGDLCVTVLSMLKTSRRPWRPWRGQNVLCATLERPRQPIGPLCAFNGTAPV